MTAAVTGAKDIDRKLEALKKSSRNKVLRPAIMKAARESAKIIKNRIPSRYKTVRAAIGAKAVKMSRSKGEVMAKAGAAVGKKMSKVYKRKAGRPGVGIVPKNVHWWFLGAKNRVIKTGPRAGQSTGTMKPQEKGITDILRPYSEKLKAIIRVATRQNLMKLAAKGKA